MQHVVQYSHVFQRMEEMENSLVEKVYQYLRNGYPEGTTVSKKCVIRRKAKKFIIHEDGELYYKQQICFKNKYIWTTIIILCFCVVKNTYYILYVMQDVIIYFSILLSAIFFYNNLIVVKDCAVLCQLICFAVSQPESSYKQARDTHTRAFIMFLKLLICHQTQLYIHENK